MFTGLIEEIGIVKNNKFLGGGIELTVFAKTITEDLVIGDSININGACQTVTRFEKDNFTVQSVEETLKKTNLGNLTPGDKVNLERSLTLNKKLGGHFVMGHVDAVGEILSIKNLNNSFLIEISYPGEFSEFIINVGAIAIEGVSLTIAGYNERSLTVSIIPHTWNSTNLHYKLKGYKVNLEFDILGKYVARMLKKGEKSTGLTEEWLKQNGF